MTHEESSHLKLSDRDASVEPPVGLKWADGAGDPHGDRRVGDDCDTRLHLPVTKQSGWSNYDSSQTAKNQMLKLVYLDNNVHM